MASCGYAALVGGYCRGSIGNPSNTQCVTMGNCAKDIRNGHLKSFGDGFADSTLKTEAELLFARAGKLHVITGTVQMYLSLKKSGLREMTRISWCQKNAKVSLLHYINIALFPDKIGS